MENDKRRFKIIDNINGVYYELYTQDEYDTYLNDIINELTKETYYNDYLGETLTYYKPITTKEIYNTIEEDANYQTIIYIDNGKQPKDPYNIY